MASPPCLAGYRHGTHTWAHVDAADKGAIRAALEQMQGRRCAYCEGDLEALGKHIEHFRRKHAFPHLTFAWVNLYWSCDQRDSCGRHKDHDAGPHNPDDLVDPCVDDPDRFFRFRSDGTIDVRPGLSASDVRRARETLRVFNLDPAHGRLRSMRRRVLEGYCARETGILEFLEGLTPEDRRTIISEELACTSGEPFSTIIRHFFEDVI
ncbi:retron system putative HNH endonuclease [Sorangium sp. So ce1036]|uniref:retron system putative HNH endonuclease n=1 Tax=Sorangium sp. So ce1036 TaxID=3133328 RepID=UPI003F0B7897